MLWNHRTWSRLVRLALATALAFAAATACDMNGTTIEAVNESDRDVTVIVRGMPDRTASRVPPDTWGTVLSSFATPSGNARVIVLDESCEEIASLAFSGGDSTVHIDVDGSVTIESDRRTPPGLERTTLTDGPCS